VPTYQYACTECGHAFEQVQSFSDDTLTTCPECTGRLRKVFNAVGVVFKGSGFYRTDSRAKESSSSSSDTKTETKSDVKTETKTETKSDSKSGSKTSDSASKTPAASTAGTSG
jgi:putative FmdB family regulatory protein